MFFGEESSAASFMEAFFESDAGLFQTGSSVAQYIILSALGLLTSVFRPLPLLKNGSLQLPKFISLLWYLNYFDSNVCGRMYLIDNVFHAEANSFKTCCESASLCRLTANHSYGVENHPPPHS